MDTDIRINIKLVDPKLDTYRPSEIWKNSIQHGLENLNSSELTDLWISRKLIRAKINSDSFEIACNEIHQIIQEDCIMQIFIPGNELEIISMVNPDFTKARRTQNLFTIGYPTLHIGIVINKISTKGILLTSDIAHYFEGRYTGVRVSTYQEGWKIYFDTDKILNQDFINDICKELNINNCEIYESQDNPTFKDCFERELKAVFVNNTPLVDFSGDDMSFDPRLR